MDIARLIEAWDHGNDSFEDNPPNAVLTGMSADGEVSIVVVLESPHYENTTLSFRYVAISDVVADRLSNVALLIDDDIRTICPPVHDGE